MIVVDRPGHALTETQFFRAPASLALPPTDLESLAVAAALLRPGGRSIEVVARGPFAWPSDQDDIIRALEDLIRDFLTQWHPPRQLWAGPAECLLREFTDQSECQ